MAGNLFKKNRLHNKHGTSLSRRINRIAPHEVTSAKVQQKRHSRSTPNRLVGRDNLMTIGKLLSGEKLKICIARMKGGIGDVLMTTPLLKAIKTRYPDCELTYATDFKYASGALKDLLENNPYIDHLIPKQQAKRNKYHLYSDITSVGLGRERRGYAPQNRIDMFADYVGISLIDSVPTFITTAKEKAWARSMINKWTKGRQSKIITMHVSSVDERRNWPVKNFAEVIKQMTHKYPDVFFIIFDQHKKGAWGFKNTQDASSYDIRAKAALIEASHLFLGPDSGLLHLAGALNKDIVSVFGSTPPEARINHYVNASAVTANVMCRFCWYEPCDLKFSCMVNIRVNDVINEIEKKLIANKALSVSVNGAIHIGHTGTSYAGPVITNSLLDSMRLSSAPLVDSKHDKAQIKMNDHCLEVVDMSTEQSPFYRQGNRMTYIYGGESNSGNIIASVAKNNVKSNEIFIPSDFARDWLIDNKIKTKIYKCPVPMSITSYAVDPSKNKSTLTFGTVCLSASEYQRQNVEDIYESFAKAFDGEIDVRLNILVNALDIAEYTQYFKENKELRIKVIEFKNNIDSFFSNIDCYIESDPFPLSMFYALQALSRGMNCISPDAKINYLPAGVTEKIKTVNKGRGYDREYKYSKSGLCESMSNFKVLFYSGLHTEGGADRAKYVKENNDPKKVARIILSSIVNE
tara:strand:- start:50013 stop:52082 length:2070 start_codon:yes stop_codon:yes gene_type:complete